MMPAIDRGKAAAPDRRVDTVTTREHGAEEPIVRSQLQPLGWSAIGLGARAFDEIHELTPATLVSR